MCLERRPLAKQEERSNCDLVRAEATKRESMRRKQPLAVVFVVQAAKRENSTRKNSHHNDWAVDSI